jgi:DNA-binding PucR family transcriptional regulator
MATAAGADLVLAGPAGLVVRALQSWVDAAGTAVRVDLAGALGAQVATVEELPRARRQAHAVLGAAAHPGRCRTLADARSAVVLAHVDAALGTLPDLGSDPLDLLFEHDRNRRTELATTLLAWLDAHGDVTAAAEGLTVHPNTFRYRLSRALAVVGVDLRDPVVRLDVHLRLRRTLHLSGNDPGSRHQPVG